MGLSRPEGRARRALRLSVDGKLAKTLTLSGGDEVALAIDVPDSSTPGVLEIRTDRSDFEGQGGPAPRHVAVRVSDLDYSAL